MPPLHGLAAHPLLSAALPAALMVTLGFWLLRPCLRRWRAERRLFGTLARLGPELRRNVVLEDGVEGLSFIDYVVLTPEGIVAVDLLPYEGAIFGSEHSDTWAAVVGHRTVHFSNPLPRQRERLAALRYNLPEVPVSTLILFGAASAFPKGRPDGALLLRELGERSAPEAVPASLRLQWERFVERVEGNAGRFGAELALVNGRRGRGRLILAAIAFAAAVVWAAAWLI